MSENQHPRPIFWQKCERQGYAILNAYDAWRSNPPILKIVLFLLAASLVWVVFPEKELSRPPGILAPQEPQRSPAPATHFFYKNYTITLMQGYDLTARILHKHSYFLLDQGSDISPMDIVFGWGIMSDSNVLDHMSFGIMNRFYRAHYDKELPYSWNELAPYVDNNHLIPATDAIEKALSAARVGELIHLKGYLVSLSKPDGYNWTSSEARGSIGDTVMTCKLIYVMQFDLVK